MSENIKVFLRIKPNVENLCSLENEDCALYKVNNNQLYLFEKKKSYNDINELNTKTFNFNHIFDVHIKQNDIFELIGKNLIDNFINGYNSSILTYGNTNSGKTYTLYGERTNSREKESNGLIYLCLNYFFDLQKINKNIEICVSIVEIYLEKIRDLGKIFELSQLSTTSEDLINYYSKFHDNIIREDENGNTYIENITLLPIKNIEDVKNIINLCFKYRKTNATKKNLVSSRSHCLLTVYQYKYFKEKEFISQINFIDLAGSEKFSDIEMINKKELININNTLSVLNRVIMALSTKNKLIKNLEKKNVNEKFKNNTDYSTNVHVPYRDSKLTRLLKNSLDGNSYTYILICLNMNSYKIDDFINSLIFAKRCKMIKQKIKKNNVKYSTNSDNLKSNSSNDSSYESFDSNSENFQFLIEENKNNIPYAFDKHIYNKKRNKIKNMNHISDIMMNKMLNLFSHIIKKKYNELVKQKNSIMNNLIKVIKSEENNKEEMKRNKINFIKILKRKKKHLTNNENFLNGLINSKEGTSNTSVKNYFEDKNNPKKKVFEEIDKASSNILYKSLDTSSMKKEKILILNKNEDDFFVKNKDNILNKYDDNVLVENKKKVTASHGSSKNQLYIQPSSFLKHCNSIICDNLTKKKDEIKNFYSDIDKLLQIEIKKLNKKIKIIVDLNSLNISLFTNVEKLTKIIKNIYQNKYNVIIKNGKKTLNISNYSYEEVRKCYDITIPHLIQNNLKDESNSLKNIDKNIITLYEKINEKEVDHEATEF
ncbi:kinesin-like protein, putative [Plasmodium relictum]|uniref:Kinesin-like protein n=1 Tax=Plasmodium relictum TaxID=85471 RepID=A0A1J1H611_PLARL|nr:kinesin-like protein, putative [Plasmodium relictum]CRH00337.1 kinesin-like protein, putative [Plasmodium relictum]